MPSVLASFVGVLTLLLVVLRLTGRISWPWWLVTLPVWFPLLLALVGGVIVIAATLRGQTP